MKKPRSFVLVTASGSVAMRYAFVLSASGRGTIDYLVIAFLGVWIAWGLWGLSRRLWRSGGAPALGHLARALTFWLVGLMNTVWARPADAGTWRRPVGVALLLLAAADSVWLAVREKRASTEEVSDGSEASEAQPDV